MVKRYSNSSVFLAALICIIVFYSGLIKPGSRHAFYSIIPDTSITCVFGQMISSPAKCSDGKYYRSKLRVLGVQSESGIKSSGQGDMEIFIPTQEVEAYYPGKLYSSATSAHLWEAGGNYCVKGKYSQSKNAFYKQLFIDPKSYIFK